MASDDSDDTGLGYRVVEANSKDDLELAVKELIRRGWVPAGGVFVVNAGRWWYYQAMTRRDESPR